MDKKNYCEHCANWVKFNLSPSHFIICFFPWGRSNGKEFIGHKYERDWSSRPFPVRVSHSLVLRRRRFNLKINLAGDKVVERPICTTFSEICKLETGNRD